MKDPNDTARLRILAVASDLFSKFGFDGVTTRDISIQAECNIASISYYFGGKEKLYKECLSYFDPQEIDIFETVLSQAKDRNDFGKKFIKFCDVFGEFVEKNSVSIKLLIQDMNSVDNTKLDSSLIHPVGQMFRDFLEAAQKEEIVNKTLNTHVLSHMVLSMIIGHTLYKSTQMYGKICDDSLSNQIVKTLTEQFFIE